MPAKRVFTYHPEIVPSDIKDNSVAAVAYQVCRSERRQYIVRRLPVSKPYDTQPCG